jgi:hypothetical protein
MFLSEISMQFVDERMEGVEIEAAEVQMAVEEGMEDQEVDEEEKDTMEMERPHFGPADMRATAVRIAIPYLRALVCTLGYDSEEYMLTLCVCGICLVYLGR